jgi:hypothetical protein
VPKTVVNESVEILGALPEAQFVKQVVTPRADDSGGVEAG